MSRIGQLSPRSGAISSIHQRDASSTSASLAGSLGRCAAPWLRAGLSAISITSPPEPPMGDEPCSHHSSLCHGPCPKPTVHLGFPQVPFRLPRMSILLCLSQPVTGEAAHLSLTAVVMDPTSSGS